MLRKALRWGARIVIVLCVIAGGAYAVKTLVLDDETKAAVPLRVQVLAPGTFASSHPYSPYYVIPRKRLRDPSRLSRQARNTLVTQPESALTKGALAGSPQIVRLALRTTSEDPVTVDGVRVRVVSDARPLRGWFTALPDCQFKPVQRARVRLDPKRPRVRYVSASGKRSRALALEVGRGGPQVLELQATTARRRVAWTAELTVRNKDGHSSTVPVSDGGKPFRVTAVRDSQAYRPVFGVSQIVGYERQRGFEEC